jgi:hypothetical protein
MKSRFQHLHSRAITLRKAGNSIGAIEKELQIPRSTLSGWFKNVELTLIQKKGLERNAKEGLVRARVKAVEWHNNGKRERIRAVENLASDFLQKIPTDDKIAHEIALAFLYLGEGAKTKSRTNLASSDLRIARFFVKSLIKLYGVPKDKIRCSLHLRADQNIAEITEYWSTSLGLPKVNFGKASVDKRTLGKETYSHYKGVCLISCGRVDIQRRLMYIANSFCDRL